MSHAVIGMFDSAAAASKAREQLIAAGIAATAIRVTPSGNVSQSSGTTTQAVSGTGAEDKGFWASVKEMFGGDEAEADYHVSHLTEGTRRGGSVLSVDATDANAERVADILTAAGAVNVDEKAEEWKSSGWKAPVAATAMTSGMRSSTTAATTGAARVGAATAGGSTGTATAKIADVAGAAGKIDLVKEDLAVGKRVVNRGGVRIVKRIIERPVEQSVSLREEHVSVDRRVVDRALTGNELTDAFKEGTVELTESGEEAVAAKTARVVGEVVVGKTATDRTETVKDTLRETDVQVEQLPGQVTTSKSTTKVVEDAGTTPRTSTKTGA